MAADAFRDSAGATAASEANERKLNQGAPTGASGSPPLSVGLFEFQKPQSWSTRTTGKARASPEKLGWHSNRRPEEPRKMKSDKEKTSHDHSCAVAVLWPPETRSGERGGRPQRCCELRPRPQGFQRQETNGAAANQHRITAETRG